MRSKTLLGLAVILIHPAWTAAVRAEVPAGIRGRTYHLVGCGKAGGCAGAPVVSEYRAADVKIYRVGRCGSSKGELLKEIQSDTDGKFSVDLPAGFYSVHVAGNSFDDCVEVKSGEYTSISVRSGPRPKRKQ